MERASLDHTLKTILQFNSQAKFSAARQKARRSKAHYSYQHGSQNEKPLVLPLQMAAQRFAKGPRFWTGSMV